MRANKGAGELTRHTWTEYSNQSETVETNRQGTSKTELTANSPTEKESWKQTLTLTPAELSKYYIAIGD